MNDFILFQIIRDYDHTCVGARKNGGEPEGGETFFSFHFHDFPTSQPELWCSAHTYVLLAVSAESVTYWKLFKWTMMSPRPPFERQMSMCHDDECHRPSSTSFCDPPNRRQSLLFH
jgi:hypothetical protein